MAYEINGLSLVVVADLDAENPIGHLTKAEQFLEAAEKLVARDENHLSAGDPENYLTGHALELLLKSFLLALGISAKELGNKNKFGHDLRKCLQEAEARGIAEIAPVSPVLRREVGLLSDQYGGKHLEYFKRSGQMTQPYLSKLLPEVRNVYEALMAVYVEASKADRAQRHRPWR